MFWPRLDPLGYSWLNNSLSPKSQGRIRPDGTKCGCGAANCRRWITGNDWLNPDLQQRYAGYFSPYLQRRIEQLSRVGVFSKARRNGKSRQVGMKNRYV